MKKKSRAEHIRHFPLLQGCCPQKSSLCSAASPPVPCQRARSTAGGWGGAEKPRRKKSADARKSIPARCGSKSERAELRTQQQHPSPESPPHSLPSRALPGLTGPPVPDTRAEACPRRGAGEMVSKPRDKSTKPLVTRQTLSLTAAALPSPMWLPVVT